MGHTFNFLLSATTIAGTILLGSASGFAAASDPSVAVLETRTAPGETTSVADGPNGFRIVTFTLGNVVVSTVESSTPNTGGNGGGGGNNQNATGPQQYADTSAFLNEPFVSKINDPKQLQFLLDVLQADRTGENTGLDAEERKFFTPEGRKEQCRVAALLLADAKEALQNAQNDLADDIANLNAPATAQQELRDFRNNNPALSGPAVTVAENKRKQELLVAEGRLLQNVISANVRSDNGGFQRQVEKQRRFVEKAKQLVQRFQKASDDCKNGVFPRGIFTSGFVHPTAGNPTRQNSTPLAFFASAGYSGFNDNRSTGNRDADIFSIVAGTGFRVNEKTALGFSISYTDGKVKSSDLNSNLTGQYYGFSLSGAHTLNEIFSLAGSLGYTHGRNKVNLAGARGKFNTNAFRASASLQGNFRFDEFVFNPSLGFGINASKNNGFTASNGIVTPSLKRTHTNFSFGGNFSRAFPMADGSVLTPSIGAQGAFFLRSGKKLALINNRNAEQIGFGATLNSGLNIKFQNGISGGFSGSYGLFKKLQTYSISAKLSVPFN